MAKDTGTDTKALQLFIVYNMVDGAYLPFNNGKFDTAPCRLNPFHFTIDNGDKGYHLPYSGYNDKNNNNYFKNDFVNNYISIKYFLTMEKKYFTKEQLKKLEVAEYHFATAVNSNFKRGTMRQMNEMLADEYEKATGEKLNRNWSCANCCLNNFKVIGRLYFESKKHYEEEEQQAQQLVFNFDAVEPEPEPAPKNNAPEKTVTNQKKKAGRPKKNK